MKVYLCYQCSYDYCSWWRDLIKVVDDEAKARAWKEDFDATETEWRAYEEVEVE